MGRYDKERPWHYWADVRVTIRLMPWHWWLRPRCYHAAGDMSSFQWLMLTVEYWNWDRGTQAKMQPTVDSLFAKEPPDGSSVD